MQVRKNMTTSGVQDPVELNADRISLLPVDVMNLIFKELNIVDAVKTSVLSREWRYKWLSSSQFSLDSDAIAHVNHEDPRWDVVAAVVNKYLRHHTSCIKLFSLKADCCNHYPDMYQWINYLSKQDVEELSIQNLGSSCFKMPSYMFSFEKLKSLSLIACSLRVPPTFGRFKCVDQMLLEDISICDGDLERLILSCPLLKNLSLSSISGLKHLRIQAPRLTWLFVDTGFEDIVIGAAPHLSIVIIIETFREPEDRPILNWRSVTHCLSVLDSLENLALSGEFIKFMAADFGLSKFMLRNHNVTYLYLHDLRFDNVDIFRVCLDLLASCRYIKYFRLSIEAAKGPKLGARFFKESRGEFFFPKLRLMHVKCPSDAGMGCAVNFIDFVISLSPGLKNLTIQREGDAGMNRSRIKNMLSRFRKSRPNASISYELDGVLTDL